MRSYCSPNNRSRVIVKLRTEWILFCKVTVIGRHSAILGKEIKRGKQKHCGSARESRVKTGLKLVLVICKTLIFIKTYESSVSHSLFTYYCKIQIRDSHKYVTLIRERVDAELKVGVELPWWKVCSKLKKGTRTRPSRFGSRSVQGGAHFVHVFSSNRISTRGLFNSEQGACWHTAEQVFVLGAFFSFVILQTPCHAAPKGPFRWLAKGWDVAAA